MDIIVTKSFDQVSPLIPGTLRWAAEQVGWSTMLINVDQISLVAPLLIQLNDQEIHGRGPTATQVTGNNLLFAGTKGTLNNFFHQGNVNSRFALMGLEESYIRNMKFKNGDDEALTINSACRIAYVDNCEFAGPDHGAFFGDFLNGHDPSLLKIYIRGCRFHDTLIRTPLAANITLHIEDNDIAVSSSGLELNESPANIIGNRFTGVPSFDPRPIRVGKINAVTGLPYTLYDNSLYLEGNTWDQSFSGQNDLVRHEASYGAVPSSMFRTVPIPLPL